MPKRGFVHGAREPSRTRKDSGGGPAGSQAAISAKHRYPDFLCVGAQKAGTSWLDKNLRRHPKLWLPPMKELQFFNELHIPASRKWTERHRREHGVKHMRQYFTRTPPENWNDRHISVLADIAAGAISDSWYGRIFSLAEERQRCGEVCPDYAMLPDDGIRHVLKLSPEVRIVLSLRDPIDRCWSQLRMDIRRGHKKDLRALEAGAAHSDLYNRSDYPRMIANWRRFIPEDRFLTIFMDDIEAHPGKVIESLSGFLGVKYREALSAKAAIPIHAK